MTDELTALSHGDRRHALLALRVQLAERFMATRSARDTAALAKQLRKVIDELDVLDAQPEEEEPSFVDELRARVEEKRRAVRAS